MADMISRMTHTKLEVGECAVKQGETGKSFYVVRSGSVDVKIAPPGQSEAQKVATLASGQYFGERSLLTSEPANATVMAAEPTDLMGLDRQAFEEILGPLQELIERVAAEPLCCKVGWAGMQQGARELALLLVRLGHMVDVPTREPLRLTATHSGNAWLALVVAAYLQRVHGGLLHGLLVHDGKSEWVHANDVRFRETLTCALGDDRQ
jgi:CRP-like cAMP-binding protein